MHTIHLIAAARPNFMKVAPLYHALAADDAFHPVLVHTGQHYDLNMSDVFFQDLGLPEPDIHLEVGSGSHAEQTVKVMMAYENILLQNPPKLTVVVGDVNSTMAATLACAKLGIKVGHLEAGLRSFDRSMPEEINRVVTDSLADVLWTPSEDGDRNLLHEGVAEDRIVRVGNIMIDSLEMMRSRIESEYTYDELGLEQKGYAVLTLHRPTNVDDPDILENICKTLLRIADRLPLVFPVHPRVGARLQQFGLMPRLEQHDGLKMLEPQSYIRFMNLVMNAKVAITDSGGIQEETTYLGVPCLTMRPNTERPITVEQGTNQLCNRENLEDKLNQVLARGGESKGMIPELWDGRAAERLVESIRHLLKAN